MSDSIAINDSDSAMTHDLQNLNADAIYAAMVWLRNYSESSEGQAEYNALMEQKAEKANFLRSLSPSGVNLRPVFKITDAFKEDIYPGEPDSVEVGFELARTIIWGPSGCASALLDQKVEKTTPITVAVSRFISDQAN